MPLSAIPVGPYDLRVPIGRGGVGEVWRAVHRRRGTPVALKVMRPAAACRPDLVASFHREVHAAAALSHPHIAPVLDAGELPPEVEALSGGRLRAGSPFLVTELAYGSLAGAPPPTSWAEVRPIALTLLDALAHAHARGVTHRDLKPGNVLLAAPASRATDGLPLGVGTLAGHDGARVLLADFGLAWRATDARTDADTASGTPAYMAPEQLDGRWRDIGPWTDMYGLGCLIWWLVGGRTPFQPRSFEQAVLHQHRMLPALRPLMAVPPGLESWLVRMVARDPGARFQAAADALFALQALPEAEQTPAPPPAPRAGLDDDITVPIRDARSRKAAVEERASPVLPCVRRAPPLPASWRELPTARARPLPLSDGLALYGLRPPPFVGREGQRDLLWAELASVHGERRTRVVLIHGLPGSGRSRLAGWLCETAGEAGGAIALKAGFGPEGEGLVGLVRATLGCHGLEGEALHGRVETWLMRHGLMDPVATRALGRLCSDAGGLGEREIFEAVRAVLSLVARARPVILVMDDAHLDPRAVALAEHLLGTGGTLPLLVVLTVRLEGEGRGEARSRLSRLLAAPLVRTLALGPLPAAQHRELVRALLPLDPDLAARVEERTSGNPGFADALLGAWIARGALSAGERGLVLAEGADPLPGELLRPWEEALEAPLAELPEEERDALVLAALMGEHVDQRSWEGACAAAGLPVPSAALVRLLAAGLIRPLPGHRPGFSFAHPLVREHLERQAARAGRLRQLHQACAEAFLETGGSGSAARLGRHAFASGDAEEALGVIVRAEGLALREACPEGLALLNLRERALLEARVPSSDRRWCELWVLRARVQLASCALEDCEASALRAEELASRHGWRALELPAAVLQGRAALHRGRLDRAEVLLTDALADADELGAPLFEVEPRLALAKVHLRRREHARAEAELGRVEAQLDGLQPLEGRARLLEAGWRSVRAALALEQGRLEDARGDLRASMGIYREIGQEGRLGESRCLAGLAEVAGAEGLHARAERRLAQAIALSERAGSAQALRQTVPLAALALERGDAWRARTTAAGVVEHLARLGLDVDAALARLVLGAASAEEGDAEAWASALALALPVFESNRWRSAALDAVLERGRRAAATLAAGEPAERWDLRLASS